MNCFFKSTKIFLVLLASVFIYSCTGVKFSQWHFPYMMEVSQGDYITTSQLEELKIGQTREEVEFILGKPLISFMFKESDLQFIYQKYKNNKLMQNYSLTIKFDNEDKVVDIIKSGEFFSE